MKPHSIRFKVSVFMKVLLHRHHPSTESRNQQSVIYHKPGLTPSCSHKESSQCQKQHQNGCSSKYTTSAHLENSSGSTQFLDSDDNSLPIGSTEATVTVPENDDPKKREAEAIVVDTWPQPAEFISRQIIFKSPVSHFFAVSQSRHALDL